MPDSATTINLRRPEVFMPLRHIDEANLDYYLLLFNSAGAERREQDGNLLSEKLAGAVRRRHHRRVFLQSRLDG